MTNQAKKAAKKSFPKKPHTTRQFSAADYQALPKGETK